MNPGEYTVTIKRAGIRIVADRTDLVQVDQTPDGVAFSFKHGLHLILSDQFMPAEAKDMVKAANSAPKGNIIFDLNSYKKPTLVEL